MERNQVYLFEAVDGKTPSTRAALVEKATADQPFGPGFKLADAQRSVRMELWCSNFNDPGPDFNLYKLIDANGKVVVEKRLEGY